MKQVAFDNTMLSLLLNPNCRVPTDPTTQVALTFHKERAQGAIEALQKSRSKIIIPAPAAAELLTAIGPDAQQYISIVSRSRLFEVGAFDAKCAIELAYMNRGVFLTHDKKSRAAAYQKVKVDRQILAIAKSNGCNVIYTDDDGLTKRAELIGMDVIHSWALPIPDKDRQIPLDLEPHEIIPEAEFVDAQSDAT